MGLVNERKANQEYVRTRLAGHYAQQSALAPAEQTRPDG